MSVHNVRWLFGPSWSLLVLLTFAVAAASFAGILPLVTLAIVLPLIVLALWQDRTRVTVVEVARTVKQQS